MEDKRDYKLFFSLLFWSLLPSIYLLIRIQFVAVSATNIDILGQMEWFDLIDEIIVTAFTVPLYFLLKKEKFGNKESGTAFLVSFGLYALFAVVIAVHVGSIGDFMKAPYAKQYLFLQTFSLLIGYICTFMVMLFTLNSDYRSVNVLTVVKLVCLVLFDWLLIPKYHANGVAYSEIVVNTTLAVATIILAIRWKYLGFTKPTKDFFRQWLFIGFVAGLQILMDNGIYELIVVRMVNAVKESGNYWVANNFIWGWLLVPVICLAEVIKKTGDCIISCVRMSKSLN